MVARAGMAPFIVTLAGMLFARGLLQAISNEGQNTYQVPDGFAFNQLGQGTWPPIITVAVFFVLGGILLAAQPIRAQRCSRSAATRTRRR